ncbi:ABC transporter substrate-binding protein [Methylocystis sp. ATCC 49242]|uniref:ABC transporter substrate-binding protein n=1 Tax=Methylocystis sp. ATCC 49242 TaxID=622637 RepID=UPI0001F8687E|nr:ABC transporter substrate-binding protein [Methylocystis sp. ATCC 49242]
MCKLCDDYGVSYAGAASVSRRHVLDQLAMGGMAALLAATPRKSWAEEVDDDVVRIGYLPITDATPLLVAHAKGYFDEEGLKVAKPTLIRGWAPLIEGFSAGKFNLVHLLKPTALWLRYNNNVPVRIVAWAHTNGSALVVQGDSEIRTFSDLGGKQLAVPFWYSMHNIVLQYALRKSGLTPVIKQQGAPLGAKEVNLQILQPPDMPPALAAKKIDGYIVAEPFDALGELNAGGRVLRFTGDIWKNHPCCVVSMLQPLIEKKPEWAQKVLNAIVRAEVYSSQHKEEVAQLLSRDGAGYLPVPANVVQRAMTAYSDDPSYRNSGVIRHADWRNGRIDFQPWPYPSATRLIVSLLKETKLEGDRAFLDKLDPDFVAKDLVDYTFVKKAIERHPEWRRDRSVSGADPYDRKEILSV